MEITKLIAGIVVAYLIGSIPTSVWIGRIFYKVDVRTRGSGNAGATNTIRVLGYKAGIPVLIFDVFKGWMAVYLAHFFFKKTGTFPNLNDLKIMMAIAAVIGHVFPIYVGFKGGKGIATLLGIGIALFPLASAFAIAIFALTIIFTGYVSLASITAAVTFPFIEIGLLGHRESFPLIGLAIAVAIFVPLTHRKNIKRLLKGEELKFKIRRNNS
jgi:glycerol-3-phosphate acyltransferase PlsY